jgi:hypothetical protein
VTRREGCHRNRPCDGRFVQVAAHQRDLVQFAKIRWRIEHHYRELILHPVPLRPKSPCAGLTPRAILRELQAPLAVWTGACHTCPSPRPGLHQPEDLTKH